MLEIDPEDLEDPQAIALQNAILARLARMARDEVAAVERQKKDTRNAYARDYYARNRERLLDDQRRMREARKQADPEAYNAQARERTKRWRNRYKTEENEKQRAKYAADPQVVRQRRKAYYAANADRLRAERREHYAAHKEQINAAARARREKARGRYDAGLPSARVMRVPIDVAHRHAVAADAFFARPRTPEQIATLDKEATTPLELLHAFSRDCARARATYVLHTQVEDLAYLHKVLSMKPYAVDRPTAKELEERRMDAIGRQINERLRLPGSAPRRATPTDPAAPHAGGPATSTNGMNR